MKKNIQKVFCGMVLLLVLNCQALSSDWLIGGWVNNGTCAKPDFVFKEQSAVINGDADGTPFSFNFENVTYAYKGSTALVDFKQPHSFLGTKSNHEIEFLLNSENNVMLIRERRGKNISSSLHKCTQ